MRIIAGSARGRSIEAPDGKGTRPITDRAKEAIFNMVMSQGGVQGTTVVDLYAGSGSFGLECLSRGAGRVIFVEQARPATDTIRVNLDRLGFADRATVTHGAVEAVVAQLPPADLAFCDPPYAIDPWPDLLARVDAELLIGHAEHDIELTGRWEEVRRRTYGRSRIVIARRAEGQSHHPIGAAPD